VTDEERAAEIAGRWLERRERGEKVDPDACLREHPDIAGPLAAAFAALRRLDEAWSDAAGDAPSRAGRTLGPYHLDAELGAGGMGTVYLATLVAPAAGLNVGVRVAVKLLHPHLFARPGFLRRFRREAEIGRRVLHENVVRTLDAGEAKLGGETARFLVLEHVEGRSLRALLDELGRVPEELCRHVGREVAKGLAAIHAAGALHRDVKPDNVLVTREHAVKLTDLGVARLADESLRISQTGAFVGSVRYAAPEQFAKADDVDGRADLYALGLTLYELATGAHPFAGDDFPTVLRRQLHDVPRPAGELIPQLSPFFEDLLARLVEKDRTKRIPSASDLARILDEGEESAWWKERRLAIRQATRRPLRRIRVPRETALYGREAELATLRGLFEKTKAGNGQVLLVEGEAGIGKSRLVDEFVGQLAQAGEDVNFLFGSYPPGGAATASGAFSTAYREHLGDDEAAIRAALPQTPLLVPAFAALLRGDVPPEDAEKLTKDSLQTVFVQATRSLAAERPTIVLVDDLHFAPEEGRALFMSLALAVPGHRILLVGCARPGLDEKWLGELAARPQTTRLALPRLGPKELVHLLRDALKSERLAEGLSALIAVKSDGNPFFVFELLRGLKDGKFLRQRPDGTWETTQIIRDIQVPSSIAELVQARVADLAPEDKNLLDVAACCGFEFDPLVVGQALGRDRVETLQALGRIEKRHRLVRAAGRRFVFDHHQVQEALYAGLSELLREEYHALLGGAIEARSGGQSKAPDELDGAVSVELVEHFLRGAKGTRALPYLDAALRRLERDWLNEAAVRLAELALAAPGLAADLARVDLLLRMAERLDLLGRRDAQRKAVDEAVELARTSGDLRRLAAAERSLGAYLFHVSKLSEAEAAFHRAIGLAQAASDVGAEANASGGLGGVLWSLGRYDEARDQLGRQIATAQDLGDRPGEARAVGKMGLVLLWSGRHDEARAQFERYLALALAIGNRREEGSAVGNLGLAAALGGRLDDARALLERQLTLAREVGSRSSEAHAIGNLGKIAKLQGRLEDALARFGRDCALEREIGDREGEAVAALNLGATFTSLGRIDVARGLLEEALALSQTIGHRAGEVDAMVCLADLARAVGDFDRAAGVLGEARAICLAIGYRRQELTARAGEAWSLLEGGRAAEGRRLLQEYASLSRDAASDQDVVFATCLLAAFADGNAALAREELGRAPSGWGLAFHMECRALLWRTAAEPADLAEAKRLLDHLVAHAPPDCRSSMLANVRLHREIVAAAGDRGVG
jgi:serine/threonine protein kinase/predicted ATPase